MDIYVCHISVEIYPTTRENKQALCIVAHSVGGMRGLVYMDFAQLWIAHGCGMWQERISQE